MAEFYSARSHIMRPPQWTSIAPPHTDTLGSHFLLLFEVDGRQYPVPHMLSLRIVEHLDVVEHLLPGFGAGFVGPAAYAFALEQVEEALGHSIAPGNSVSEGALRRVVAVPAAAQRGSIHSEQLPSFPRPCMD